MVLSRSEQMARIRRSNTTPEKLLRHELWHAGLRYRVQARTPGGRADIVFPGRRLAVFIDGCFWHGCPDHYVLPRTRQTFWQEKLKANVERDQRQTGRLSDAGWRTLRLWEHEIYEDLRNARGIVEQTVRLTSLPAKPGWRVVHVRVLNEETELEERTLVTLQNPPQDRVEVRRRTTAKVAAPRPLSRS